MYLLLNIGGMLPPSPKPVNFVRKVYLKRLSKKAFDDDDDDEQGHEDNYIRHLNNQCSFSVDDVHDQYNVKVIF